jgi:hypothetical protein
VNEGQRDSNIFEVVETLQETYVVFSLAQKDYTRIVLILGHSIQIIRSAIGNS